MSNIHEAYGKTRTKRPKLSAEEFLANKPAIAELAEIDRWVCWRLRRRGDKDTKVPYQVDGSLASATNPATWTSFDACHQAAFGKGKHDGIGFVLTNDDDIMAFDLDDCLEDGKLEPWAQDIAERVKSYVEITPSGVGIRIICRGKLPVAGRKEGSIEVYESARYITITGEHLAPFPKRILRRPNAVREIYDELFEATPKANGQDHNVDGNLGANPDKFLQEGMLVLLTFSPEHAKQIRDCGVEPWQFEGGEFRQIATELYKYLHKYETTPGDQLEDLFAKILLSKDEKDVKKAGLLRDVLHDIHSNKDSVHPPFVMDRLKTFVVQQKFKRAILETAERSADGFRTDVESESSVWWLGCRKSRARPATRSTG
jgi:hypothetical protein